MIDLYSWTTPNGRKVSILLEELGVTYKAHAIDIGAGDQYDEAFLKISPNNKIPALVDHETGITLMESGAIMLYLADKYDKFMPMGKKAYWEALQWLMWQKAGFGPMLGQGHYFSYYNTGVSPHAADRFLKEANRLYSVLDRQLNGRAYICGDYSIVDMACWPWVSRYEWHKVDLGQYPHVQHWYQCLKERPAVKKGYQVPHPVGDIPPGT